ncbi:MAG: hypothetical protein VX642_02185, partial [Bdellovibrionota bacterium]|nr:hypothetical protein [Bdellovibrionota bacterium]
MKAIICLLFVFFICPNLMASHYILTSIEPATRGHFFNAIRGDYCKSSAAFKNGSPFFQSIKIASSFLNKETGVMDYESRGMILQTRAEFKEEIDALLEFVRHDWYATGEYSLKEVNDIFLNEQSLDVLRTRHFVVEAPGERLFSSIRVYENSKSYEFWNRSQEKIAPPRDLIFEKFNISQEN